MLLFSSLLLYLILLLSADLVLSLSRDMRRSPAARDGGQTTDVISNVQALIERVMLRGGISFRFTPKMELIPYADGGIDVFELDSDASYDTLIIRGSSAVALSAGFGHYVRHFLNCDFHWEFGGNYSFYNFPKSLSEMPIPTELMRVTFLGKYRYYQNTCTASYSFAWRGWTSWEQEIDWMALSGINLPLAFTGQEIVWQKLWQSYGVSQAGIDAFFTGPAFLAWNRMSNIRGFGGPLPQSYITEQADLQRKILARYKELEITPVLPAFNGVVPEELKVLYPNSSISQLGPWADFPEEYTCNYILSSTDPLFVEIGSSFIKMQQEEFGQHTHIYNADTFNENEPTSADPAYLRGSSSSVYTSMITADPDAIWLMQDWLFRNDADFWNDDAIAAYLGGVPDDGMIILDLSSDEFPQWQKLTANNKSFIWCVLHNYGGARALYGNLTNLAVEPLAALRTEPKLFVGTGLTMEAIDQNPVIYEFMIEVSKSQIPIDPKSWLQSYAERRYSISGSNAHVANIAWQQLFVTVYNGTEGCKRASTTQPCCGGEAGCCLYRSIITMKPDLELTQVISIPAEPMVQVWSLIQTAGILHNTPAWRYDLVDVGRQVMANLFWDLYVLWKAAYMRRAFSSFRSISTYLLTLISDWDRLLATHEAFLLGTWLEDAKLWANDTGEEQLYNFNARNQLTLWGPSGQIDDYAAKNWAGLVGGYYSPRWQLLTDYMSSSIESGLPFDIEAYDNDELEIGQTFCNDESKFPTVTVGSTSEVSFELQKKYGSLYLSPFGYDIIVNTDIHGSEDLVVNGTWTKSIAQLQFLCDADPLCLAFTTTGFLKAGTDGKVAVQGIDVYVKL